MTTNKIYVDYSEITIDTGTFMTELTWLNGDDYGYTPRHYFIDYPGVKDLERQVSEVIGGSPLIRYSMPTVLKTFINEIDFSEVLFISEEKASKFIEYLNDLNIDFAFMIGSHSNIEIDDLIYKARKRAASRFGNAL